MADNSSVHKPVNKIYLITAIATVIGAAAATLSLFTQTDSVQVDTNHAISESIGNNNIGNGNTSGNNNIINNIVIHNNASSAPIEVPLSSIKQENTKLQNGVTSIAVPKETPPEKPQRVTTQKENINIQSYATSTTVAEKAPSEKPQDIAITAQELPTPSHPTVLSYAENPMTISPLPTPPVEPARPARIETPLYASGYTVASCRCERIFDNGEIMKYRAEQPNTSCQNGSIRVVKCLSNDEAYRRCNDADGYPEEGNKAVAWKAVCT